MYVEQENSGKIEWGNQQRCYDWIEGGKLILVRADYPIRPGEGGDLSASACWPILVCNPRKAMRNQVRVRVKLERAIMPENQRQISSGQCVPRADLSQVRVVDEETDQEQEEWDFQRLQVKGDRSSGRW